MSESPAEIVSNGVVLMPKHKSRPMRFLGFFLGKRFMTDFWTTYRLPFCKPVITYPSRVKNPEWHTDILVHEMVHVAQFAPWYGPLWVFLLVTIFPLPVFFSGRWLIERRAYLQDILSRRMTVEQCVDVLWRGYGMCWPKPWMKQWFFKELSR